MSRSVGTHDLRVHSRTARTHLFVGGVVALTVLVAAVAACGGDDQGVPSSDYPTGGRDVVLRVSTAGGFVPVSYSLTEIPQFTLFGDGTVVVTGPIPAIYPGPALPNLQTAKISAEAIGDILSAAREAGLFANGVDYGQPGITDVGTTSIVVNAGGQTYRSDIYALGMEAGAGGLTIEQQQARAAIGDLVGKLGLLSDFEPAEIEWQPYAYSALKVFSVAVDPAVSPDDLEVQPNELAWPLGDLGTLGEAVMPAEFRSVVVTEADLATLRPLLADATQITLWTSGEAKYNLYFRPLLPDETS